MRYLLFLLIVVAASLTCPDEKTAGTLDVKTGLDVLISERAEILENKHVAVIANHSSVTAEGKWILNALSDIRGLEVAMLFTPEHGLDLLDPDSRERWKNIRSVDLHTGSRRPDASQLSDLDAILYDIQDTGCRFYTYISTMLLVMDAAKEAGVEFIVLDRPNPLGGLVVEGPLLLEDFRSFVGMYPIPVRYGLTPGELARMANGEGYLPSGGQTELNIVKMKNWKRSMYYDDTGLRWTPPSPNMPDLETTILYPGMCLIEGTNLSEGRGTSTPFRLVGAPWLTGPELLEQMAQMLYTGVSLAGTTFTPVPIPGKCETPKYAGIELGGLSMRVTGRDTFKSFDFGVLLLRTVAAMKPDEFEWTGKYYIDRLAGTDELRKAINSGTDPAPLLRRWEEEARDFARKSRPYFLYGN